MDAMIVKNFANVMCEYHILPSTRHPDVDRSNNLVFGELPNMKFMDGKDAIDLLNILADIFE